ncbi:MAG: hypothetical protein BWY29_00454 [Microgenomates group bacterium ADurb.Bin238]|nr:MAG: hypothetical protein BWY29_00454 [Microgenomates group bacterium ADurb.Bin238]
MIRKMAGMSFFKLFLGSLRAKPKAMKSKPRRLQRLDVPVEAPKTWPVVVEAPSTSPASSPPPTPPEKSESEPTVKGSMTGSEK